MILLLTGRIEYVHVFLFLSQLGCLTNFIPLIPSQLRLLHFGALRVLPIKNRATRLYLRVPQVFPQAPLLNPATAPPISLSNKFDMITSLSDTVIIPSIFNLQIALLISPVLFDSL